MIELKGITKVYQMGDEPLNILRGIDLSVKEGDKIRAWFLFSENGEMHFTTRIGSGPAARAQLEDAFRSGIPVEGTVTKELKGGFEITIPDIFARIAAKDGELKQLMGMILDYASKEAKRQGKL